MEQISEKEEVDKIEKSQIQYHTIYRAKSIGKLGAKTSCVTIYF